MNISTRIERLATDRKCSSFIGGPSMAASGRLINRAKVIKAEASSYRSLNHPFPPGLGSFGREYRVY